MSDNYYSILGCTKGSSSDEIKKSYKKLALLHHPDKNNGNDEMFKKINEAYSVLSEPEKKERYDRFGSADANPFERQGHGHGSNFPFGGFEHFFSGGFPFGGGQSFSFHSNHQTRETIVKKCSNIQITLDITLENVFSGFSILHTFDQKNGCKCMSICGKCRGKGVIHIVHDLGMIKQTFQTNCPDCSGSGLKGRHDCNDCSGSGYSIIKKQIKINGPKGLDNGHTLTLPRGGEQPSSNAPHMQPGDLLITLSVKEHSLFKREGKNLIFKTDCSWIDSICGKEIDIPLFEEPFTMNTQEFGILYPDKKYTISNKGLYDVNGNRGDLYIYFTIIQPNIPKEKCNELREHLSTFLNDKQV